MPTIEVSEETYQKIKDQLQEDEKCDVSCLADMVGKKFFFRTVTYHIVGKVVGFFGSVVQMEEASWVADSGRFADAIKTGILDEVEPLGEWYVNTQTVTDFGPWKHKLPKDQK